MQEPPSSMDPTKPNCSSGPGRYKSHKLIDIVPCKKIRLSGYGKDRISIGRTLVQSILYLLCMLSHRLRKLDWARVLKLVRARRWDTVFAGSSKRARHALSIF